MAIRSLINLILGLIGYSIPKFAYFVNILGAIGGASLNFIFPILIHKKYFEKDELKRKSKFNYYGILTFGICGGLCSFIYTIVKLTSHWLLLLYVIIKKRIISTINKKTTFRWSFDESKTSYVIYYLNTLKWN